MSRHRHIRGMASEAQDEYLYDREEEEYYPSESEIKEVKRGIGKMAELVTEEEIISTLCQSSTVKEAIDWIKAHPGDYGGKPLVKASTSDEYYPTPEEVEYVYEGIGQLGDFISEDEIIATLLQSQTVEEAIERIICHPENYGNTPAASAPAASIPTPKTQPKSSPKPSAPKQTTPIKTPGVDRQKSTPAAAKTPSTSASKSTTKKTPASKGAVARVKSDGMKSDPSWGVSDDLGALNLTRDSSADSPSVMSPESGDDLFAVRASEHDGKECVNLVFVGHIDAGKSTLNGNLLYLAGHVSKQKMHKFSKESKAIGKGSFALAWVMDGNKEERERGVTMDVGVTHFYTDTKKVILLDAPGHRDFVPNMISGAAQADAAVLVVDATKGEFETGFSASGQTREHAMLVRSLGIAQLIVAVNKMDMAGWSRGRFEEISGQLSPFLKTCGFAESNITFVPCSGFSGENLIARANPELESWYSGVTIVQAIDQLRPPLRMKDLSLRMCVCDVFRNPRMGLTVAGKIEAGSLAVGDKVLVMPGYVVATVKSIESEMVMKTSAEAGENISVGLGGLEPTMIGIGYVLCSVEDPIPLARRCRAQIITFDIETPLTLGHSCIAYTQSAHEAASVTKLVDTIDRSTGQLQKKRPRCILKNSAALIEITFDRPVCLELFQSHKSLGRITLREMGKTIAAGTVTRLFDLDGPPQMSRTLSSSS